MIIRKILTILLATFISPMPIAIWDLSSGFGFYWLLFIFGTPFLLFYGMPVSFLSDIVTKKATTPLKRSLYALFIHIFFGLVLIIPFSLLISEPLTMFWNGGIGKLLFICSTVSSFIVWTIDEILRKVANWEKIQSAM
ncbi:hypothetical protein [Sutcliffiella rhizosphaerae]|uniref:Uncharacterized protein n=1 Tax=Sutcliffiella rhizosphaerae TaxID=2880967 RepID=A0ABM8YKN8_9BACI|nr:hypothetical protein [Sutcliffiella rhizosphaerae]CAG9620424.1 hypothetical protein BACCIP111883_01192 [Sutcliffiella rhizosphaerae]